MDQGLVRYFLVSRGSQLVELNHDHLLVRHLVDIDHSKDAMLETVREHVESWAREPRAVVLFGSVARHEDTTSSDVDLLIVWKGTRAPSDDWTTAKIRLVESVMALTGNVANIMDFSGPDWEYAIAAGEALVSEVARDGVSVTGTSVRTLTRPDRKVAAR